MGNATTYACASRVANTACMHVVLLRNEPGLLLPALTNVMPTRGFIGRMHEQKPSGVQQAPFHVGMHVGEGGSAHSQLGFELVAGVVASHCEVRAVRLMIAAGQT